MSVGRLGGAPRNLCLSLWPRCNSPLPNTPPRGGGGGAPPPGGGVGGGGPPPPPPPPGGGASPPPPPGGGGWEGGTALATGPAAPDDIYMSHSRPNGRSS